MSFVEILMNECYKPNYNTIQPNSNYNTLYLIELEFDRMRTPRDAEMINLSSKRKKNYERATSK